MFKQISFRLLFISTAFLFTSFCPSNQEECFNTIAGNMMLVSAGKFKMGSDKGNADEKPIHEVSLKSFYISKYEVTQQQWVAVMGKNPSYFKDCPLCPVDNISWVDAIKFISKLNEAAGQHYRLPTEAEWEYAARGGNESSGNEYSGSNTIDDVGWTNRNSSKKTHPVGTKMPNELAIYDMTGNVAEWCSDWYDERYYTISPSDNPQGPRDGNWHVLRGGSWFCFDVESRIAYRNYPYSEYRMFTLGLRLAKDL
ncbi:MAG: Sulphatase-modifying factor protein [Bacteroidota bacterium]|nr:Sulphatase-modifying factor protein [Bacteroidota bacterium]